jgi:hypothetical protein
VTHSNGVKMEVLSPPLLHSRHRLNLVYLLRCSLYLTPQLKRRQACHGAPEAHISLDGGKLLRQLVLYEPSLHEVEPSLKCRVNVGFIRGADIERHHKRDILLNVVAFVFNSVTTTGTAFWTIAVNLGPQLYGIAVPNPAGRQLGNGRRKIHAVCELSHPLSSHSKLSGDLRYPHEKLGHTNTITLYRGKVKIFLTEVKVYCVAGVLSSRRFGG